MHVAISEAGSTRPVRVAARCATGKPQCPRRSARLFTRRWEQHVRCRHFQQPAGPAITAGDRCLPPRLLRKNWLHRIFFCESGLANFRAVSGAHLFIGSKADDRRLCSRGTACVPASHPRAGHRREPAWSRWKNQVEQPRHRPVCPLHVEQDEPLDPGDAGLLWAISSSLEPPGRADGTVTRCASNRDCEECGRAWSRGVVQHGFSRRIRRNPSELLTHQS